MRIVWRDYVSGQLAWWRSLNKLAQDPSVDNGAYLSAKALAAYANARAVADAPHLPRRKA